MIFLIRIATEKVYGQNQHVNIPHDLLKLLHLNQMNILKKISTFNQMHWDGYFSHKKYRAYLGGGGGGMLDFASPTHATMPTARIIHPHMSYLRSLLLLALELWNKTKKLISSFYGN